MGVSLATAALVLAVALVARAAIAARVQRLTLRRITSCTRASVGAFRGFGITSGRHGPRRDDSDVAAIARAMARSLRAGYSPVQALASALWPVPNSTALARVIEHAESVGLGGACAAWRSIDDRSGVRLITTALEVGASAGGPLARALDGVADTVDSRAAIAREMRAQAATARASAVVLVAAPVGFGVFLMSGDQSALSFFTGTAAGAACLVLAAALDIAGAWWMAKITAGAP